MEEVKKAPVRKRRSPAVKPQVTEPTASVSKKLVWKWMSETQELVQVEVDE